MIKNYILKIIMIKIILKIIMIKNYNDYKL